MRLTKSETKILELFINNIFLETSINNIAKTLKKHYRVIRVNILNLLKKNIVKSTDLAGAKVISLNIDETTMPSYMAYVEEIYSYNQLFKHLPHIDDIIKKAREISPCFCLGIFGSYVKNIQKKDSDIDMFLICSSSKLKEYESLINQFPSLEDKIHWNVFTIDEFKQGLKTKGTLVYKEITKNKSIIRGAELFYNLIAEVGKIED